MRYCVEDLEKEGWEVFKRGFPSLVAVKDCQMRMFVINPLVAEGPVILGAGKDALAEQFYKCFGVQYEIYQNQEKMPEREPRRWM